MNYTLTAELGSVKRTHRFNAVDDADAMFTGTMVVMGKAYRYQGVWANGRIELRDPEGNIVSEMEAKC